MTIRNRPGLCFLLGVVLPMTCFAQNICTNGNFDTYTTPPTSYAQVCRATGWLSPSGICSIVTGTGSPDYYNTAGSGGAQPPSTWWATVNPHSGGGMAGFATWYTSSNYREYVGRPLSSPMVVGQTYRVTLWLTNGISWLHLVGTDNIGICFSLSPLTQSGGSPIAATPQIETNTIMYDTAWFQLVFTFVATAPYQYMTVGNFHDDASTQKQSFGSGSYANYGAYYYIDDVVVEPGLPLPVEWLYFHGRRNGNAADLSWATASETGSDYFEIQRSTDGRCFLPVGLVAAAGNSTTTTDYAFHDPDAPGPVYYRLLQVDRDGAGFFSEVVFVAGSDGGADALYVAYAGNLMTVSGLSERARTLEARWFSPDGRVIRTLSLGVVSGSFSVSVPVAGMQQGPCLVRVTLAESPVPPATAWVYPH